MSDTCQLCGESIDAPDELTEVVWPADPARRMGPYHAECIREAIFEAGHV